MNFLAPRVDANPRVAPRKLQPAPSTVTSTVHSPLLVQPFGSESQAIIGCEGDFTSATSLPASSASIASYLLFDGSGSAPRSRARSRPAASGLVLLPDSVFTAP